MKKITFALFILIAALVTHNTVLAQDKIAYINTQELIQSMPEMREALKQLEDLSKSYESDIQQKLASYQAKVQQYDSEAATKTDAENQARIKEVEQLQKELAKFRDDATADISKKRDELLKPIYDKARTAVEAVAEKQGINYVLDSTQGGGVIVHQGKNLMPDVKAKLGI